MNKSFLSIAVLAVLASCAYTQESAIQDISVVTPGAQNARCVMEIEGFKHTLMPPETINVTKSNEDMVLYCRAPGNRERTVTVSPALSDAYTIGAVATLGIGGLWDYASGASHYYPDVIEVDFTNIPVRPEPLPQHNAPDIRQPDSYLLEEFLPGQPRLNSDRYEQQQPILRRQRSNRRSILSSGYDPSSPGTFTSEGESYLEGEMPETGFDFDDNQGAADVLDPSSTQSDVVGDVLQGMKNDQASEAGAPSVVPAQDAGAQALPAQDLGAPPEVSPSDVQVVPTP